MLAIAAKRRFEAGMTLKNDGIGIDAIARQRGLARETVRRFYCASRIDEVLGNLFDDEQIGLKQAIVRCR